MSALRLLLLGFVIAGGLLSPRYANAQVQDLLGEWQQISSNAGQCERCRISFAGGLPELSVTSNNGWTATVEPKEIDGQANATGEGRWSASARPLAAMPFKIVFELRDQRLYMTMIGEIVHGKVRIIRAVFGRVWLGA